MAKRIQVGGRIESKEVGGIVTGAAEILDDAKGKKQSVVNQETDTELERLDQSKQDNLTFDNVPTEGSNNPVRSGGVYAADKALSDAIEAILLLIPSASSALNKLVDTAMMNSSISTATATFKGTYNVVTDLSLTVDATHEQIAAALGNVISTADNNDYAFVQVPVSAESMDIRRTERYKFNGTAWGYEYDLNTSGFTAAQWTAINSGITIALVGKLIGLPTSSELQALLGQKQNTLTFDNVPTAGSANPVKSGGVHTAINDEKMAREQLEQTVTGIDGRVENVEEVIPTGAAANNKLVANNSMEAYVTSIIEAITASFTIATADGHINLTLTQTNGRVASLTLISSDIASAQALTALTGRVYTAESNITLLGGRVSTNETDIANLQQLYNDLQQSKPEPVTALPETGQQQGVIYRLAGTTSYSDYMWNGSTWVLMATYNNAIDPRPKKASQNLVTSGGVFDNMGALDVSELNATENPHTLAQYVDLSAALAAVPTDYQKGGMSIKFVQSSDNKYVQWRLMSDSFNTTVVNWQGVDDIPTADSDNLVKSGGVYSNNINRPSKTIISNLIGETGKYIRNDGVVIENPAYNISPVITLLSGERIDVTCFAYQGNVAAISEYKNGVYYPIRVGDENVVKTYSYINLTDTAKYIVLSYANELAYSASIYSSEITSKLAGLKNTVIDDLPTIDSNNGAKSDSVAKIEKVLGVELQDVDFTTSTGYITQSGSFVENASYSHTSQIELGVGETIIVKAACYPGNVCKLAKVENNAYIPIINPSVYEFTYSYYINRGLKPINVIVSFDNTLGVVIQKTTCTPQTAFDQTPQRVYLNPVLGVVNKLSIVKDWGFIGDSHMSGACQYMRIDGTVISDNYFAYSWGQLMCSRCNTIGTNWSYGGMTAKDWINRYWNGRTPGYKTGGGEEIFETNPKKVYVICMGTNDSYSSISIGSFSDVDINDFNNNADTFYGNYCGIIQRIKYIQPSAKIFVVNIPTIFSTHERISQINDAILDISSRFTNLFFVDLLNLIPNNSEIMSKYALNNHLTLNGYLWISYVIGDIMDNIISNNLHAFDSLPMIGTPNDNGTL